jgi:translation elongation factor EF-1beta
VYYKMFTTFLDNALNFKVIVDRRAGEQDGLADRVSNCVQVTRVDVESSLLFRIF